MTFNGAHVVNSLDYFLLLYGNPLYINGKKKLLFTILIFIFFIFRAVVVVMFWGSRFGSIKGFAHHQTINFLARYAHRLTMIYFFVWLTVRRNRISKFFCTISCVLSTKYHHSLVIRRQLNRKSFVIVIISLLLFATNVFCFSYFALALGKFNRSHIIHQLVISREPFNVTIVHSVLAIIIYFYDNCFENFQIVTLAVYITAYSAKSAAFRASLYYMSKSIDFSEKLVTRKDHVKLLGNLNKEFENLFSALPFICILTSHATAISFILGDDAFSKILISFPLHLAISSCTIVIIYTTYPMIVLVYLSIKQEQLITAAQAMYYESRCVLTSKVDIFILKEFIKYVQTKITIAGFYTIDRTFICTSVSSFLAMGVLLVQLFK